MPLYIWNGSKYVRVDDGAGNIQIKNVVYDTDKDGIIDKVALANVAGDIVPSVDATYSVGSKDHRWLGGWFAGNLGLGVIKNIGDTLTVDVIAEGNYVEVASNTTSKTYELGNHDERDDWDIGTLQTFTENGVLTRVKLEIDGEGRTWAYYYKLYEDGVEVLSIDLDDTPASGEYITRKTSASFKGRIERNGESYETATITERRLYMKKVFLGIKAGQ